MDQFRRLAAGANVDDCPARLVEYQDLPVEIFSFFVHNLNAVFINSKQKARL